MSDPLLAHRRVFQQVRRDTAILKAMDALDRAEKQFTFYAEHHKLRADEALLDKAEREKRRAQAATNYSYALLCADALENLMLVCNPLDGQPP